MQEGSVRSGWVQCQQDEHRLIRISFKFEGLSRFTVFRVHVYAPVPRCKVCRNPICVYTSVGQ
jgi:hypothetical protein